MGRSVMLDDERGAALRIQGLYKVFADDRGEGLELARAGHSKDEIQESIGAVVGLRDINVDIRRGELFVVHGALGLRQIDARALHQPPD